jgi:hypothetical protein
MNDARAGLGPLPRQASLEVSSIFQRFRLASAANNDMGRRTMFEFIQPFLSQIAFTALIAAQFSAVVVARGMA